MAAFLWALPALLAFLGAWRVSDDPRRTTLRLAGAAALWATITLLLIVRS